MFIDIHVHPEFFEVINQNDSLFKLRQENLTIFKNGIADMKHIENQMNCAGIDRACILANPEEISAGRAAVSNDEIKKIVDSNPSRFIGFASINPIQPNSIEILEDAFARLSLRGLKLNPAKQNYDPFDERIWPIYELCIKYDRPVIFHSGFSWETDTSNQWSHPLCFEKIAKKYPKLRICLAHFGWPWVRETAMLLLKYPNVYADTGILYFDDAETFYTQVFTKDIPLTWIDRSLRHQVMFGSDNPRFEQIRMAKAIEKLGYRDSTVNLIKGENALVFIGEK